MKNFDRYVGIDWSGAKAPVFTKSIAVAYCEAGEAPPCLVRGPQNGKWSRTAVADWILSLLKTPQRVLIGIDANFGYAKHVGISQFGKSYNYKTLWGDVEAKSKQDANFLAQGFWEAWPQYFWTEGKQPAHITLPKRTTETVCGEAGCGWPESPFKLLGPKQVGKGGLAAMRMAHYLKREAGDKICIWPFEKHIADTSQIVISEIYPRQFLRRSMHGNAKVNSLKALNEVLQKQGTDKIKNKTYRFNDHDADAIVSASGLRMLCGSQKTLPKSISDPPFLNEKAVSREGWIFGVGDQ